MAINIRQGFSRVSLLIQILYVVGCFAVLIDAWPSATDSKYVDAQPAPKTGKVTFTDVEHDPFAQVPTTSATEPAAKQYITDPDLLAQLNAQNAPVLAAAEPNPYAQFVVPPQQAKSPNFFDQFDDPPAASNHPAAPNYLAPLDAPPRTYTTREVDYDPFAQTTSPTVWEDRIDLAKYTFLALCIGVLVLRLLSFTIAWLWDGFAKQPEVM